MFNAICPVHSHSYFLIAAFYAALYYLVLESDKKSQVTSYGRALIASLQIQSTIGFAAPGMDHWARNWRVIMGITLQSVSTVLFNIFLLGTLFARLVSARNRAITVRVSSVAVINGAEEQLPFLQFRVGELRRHQLMNISVSAYLFTHKKGKMYCREKLALEPPNGIFLAVPSEIRHVLNETSPLFHFLSSDEDHLIKSFECSVCGESFRDRAQLVCHMKFENRTHEQAYKDLSVVPIPSYHEVRSKLNKNQAYWEVVVLIEGTEPVTGSPIQVRQSYTISDLKFGAKFKKCWALDTTGSQKRIIVDFDNFEATE